LTDDARRPVSNSSRDLSRSNSAICATSERQRSHVAFQLCGDPDKADSGDCLDLAQIGPPPLRTLTFHAGGSQWFEGPWESGAPTAAPARWTLWRSQPEFDLAEWSFRVGEARVAQLAFLLRGRRLALLAQQVTGSVQPCAFSIGCPSAVRARTRVPSRALYLTRPRQKGAISLLPIGLPAAAYETDRGALRFADGRVTLTQALTGQRTFMPLVLSWHPDRDRRAPHWRVLTVTQERKVCKPGVAFAARLGWRGEPFQFVIYRSLGPPALRCFMGHQTSARTLIALFSPDGELEPIVSVGGPE
jgi:hypothetical protein